MRKLVIALTLVAATVAAAAVPGVSIDKERKRPRRLTIGPREFVRLIATIDGHEWVILMDDKRLGLSHHPDCGCGKGE